MIDLANEVIAMIIGITAILGTAWTIIKTKANQLKNSVQMNTMSANKITSLCDDVTKLKQDTIAHDLLNDAMQKNIAEKIDRTAFSELKYDVAKLQGKFEQHNDEGVNKKQ